MTIGLLRQHLDERGVAVVRDLLPQREVAALRWCIDELRRTGSQTTRQILYTHRRPTSPRPPFSDLMEQWLNPHLLTDPASTRRTLEFIAAEACGFLTGMRPFQDVLLVKQPHHREFPWHQDEPFWPWDAPEGLVIWCALDAVDQTNGAVEVAVGSHSLGRDAAIDLHTGLTQVDGRLPDLRACEVICPTLAPGDAVIFRPRTWHRSGLNRTAAPRRAWSTSWLPLSATWRPDLAPLHPLVRSSTKAKDSPDGSSA